MARPGGLGRGLASLIPQNKKKSQEDTQKKDARVNYFGKDDDYETKPSSIKKKEVRSSENKKTNESNEEENIVTSNKSVIEIPVEDIMPNPHQPRKFFDEAKLSELASSIKRHGILQPLTVNKEKAGKYELIAGERRLEASKIAGLEKVSAIVRESNDEEKMELALVENIQRHNLNVIEEARAYRKMKERFGFTQEDISQKVGKSRSAVANALRLLSLPVEIQRAIFENKITEGHARMILAIENPEKQRAFLELILKDNLSVRQTEAKVKEIIVSGHKRKVVQIDPEIQEKEEALSNNLGTKVKIKKNRKGGQVAIDFYSIEELNNLIDKFLNIE